MTTNPQFDMKKVTTPLLLHMLGSAAGGWLFGAYAHLSFGWLAVPLLVMLSLVLLWPAWWSVTSAKSVNEKDL